MTDQSGPRLVWERERPFASVAWEDIAPRTVPSLLKGVLPRLGTGFLVGASKAGKTFIALDWSYKLAAGAPTIMQRRAQHVGVAYVAAEDPSGVELRIEALKRKFPRESYTAFRLIKKRVNLLDPDSVDGLIAELHDIDAIFAEKAGVRLGMVVVDTLSRCLPGAEENSSQSMSLAVDSLDRIGLETEAFVFALAHHGKDTARGIRGWSGLDAASDATISVERGDPEKGDDPNLRTLTMSKVKNGKDGDQVAFRLERQPIGFDEDGDEMFSAYVQYEQVEVEVLKGKSKKRKALSPSAEIVLTALGRLIDREIRQAPPSTAQGVRQGTWAVRRSDLSLEAGSIGLSYDGEKSDAFRQRFGRAVNELQAAQRIRVDGDAVWPI